MGYKIAKIVGLQTILKETVTTSSNGMNGLQTEANNPHLRKGYKLQPDGRGRGTLHVGEVTLPKHRFEAGTYRTALVAAIYSSYGPLKSSIVPFSKCQMRVATSSIKS